MTLTHDQLNELEGIYNTTIGNKDKETKKLVNALKNTIDFINFDYTIEIFCRWTDSWASKSNTQYSLYSQHKKLNELPITVLIYILTKDDKYLGHYKKAKRKDREYIYHGGNCYYTDCLYIPTTDFSCAIK